MAKVPKNLQMVIPIQDTIQMVFQTDMGNIFGMMEVITKVTLNKA